jgi:hypothetical protein
MTGSAQTGAPGTLQDSSTGELMKQLSEQLSRLVRDELKLAEAEMASKGSRAAKGVGLFGGSGIFALYGLGCLLAAAIAGLALVVAIWLAALIDRASGSVADGLRRRQAGHPGRHRPDARAAGRDRRGAGG